MKTVIFMDVEISNATVLDELKEFDRKYKDTNDYENWKFNSNYKHMLVYEGRHYPPKYILQEASGIHRTLFNGGDQTNDIFRNLGFDIEDKS